MARKVEFLAQEDAVPGTKIRTQVYLNLEPQGPGCGGPHLREGNPSPRTGHRRAG